MALRDYNAAVDFVDRNVAEGRGDKTAFIDGARNLTYGELRDAAARIGPMLLRMGIEPENRVALVLLDTVDFPILFWGAIRAGVVPVLVNTRLTVDQYRYLFEDSRAKAVFVSAALLPMVQEAAKDLPSLKQIQENAAYGVMTTSMRVAWQIARDSALLDSTSYLKALQNQLRLIEKEIVAAQASRDELDTLARMQVEYMQCIQYEELTRNSPSGAWMARLRRYWSAGDK